MPSGFESLPRDVFVQIAELLPMGELLDLRQTSTTMNDNVVDYLDNTLMENGRILDKKEFSPIDRETSTVTVIMGLADRKMVRQLNILGEEEAIKTWDNTIQTALRNEPLSPDIGIMSATRLGIARASSESDAPVDKVRFLDEQLQLRQGLHVYLEYCLKNGLLTNDMTGTVRDDADVDVIFELWADGEVQYDRKKLK
jgi:hypothetical protein